MLEVADGGAGGGDLARQDIPDFSQALAGQQHDRLVRQYRRHRLPPSNLTARFPPRPPPRSPRLRPARAAPPEAARPPWPARLVRPRLAPPPDRACRAPVRAAPAGQSR